MIGREIKVALVTAIAAFVLIMLESSMNGDVLSSRLSHKAVISVGCGFTAWLAMHSWFKEEK
jgi:hypothetical protein